MASSPGYDLNLFTDGISRKNWKSLLKDPAKPLFDRPLMGQYLPGSVVKPLVALAARFLGVVRWRLHPDEERANTKENCKKFLSYEYKTYKYLLRKSE